VNILGGSLHNETMRHHLASASKRRHRSVARGNSSEERLGRAGSEHVLGGERMHVEVDSGLIALLFEETRVDYAHQSRAAIAEETEVCPFL